MSHPNDEGKAPRHIRALSPRFRTKGISGTQLNGGVISKESNPQLTGLNWVQEAEDMLRTDPIVRRSWHMLRQTLLSATWRFEPGVEGDIVSEELARYANEAFGFCLRDSGSLCIPIQLDIQPEELIFSFLSAPCRCATPTCPEGVAIWDWSLFWLF